ncbi:MAG: ATP-binding cassette domain-containing protein [Thermoanaerobacteraceae bacterium]|nr:ATP-binding cassette domain-containing protein [Thermoanaerobacteraceae bacterium]
MLSVNIFKELPAFPLQIELTVKNEVLVVLGPSGAGKTTLLQCLSGLQKPRRGEIVLNGRVLFSSTARVNLPPRHRRVGYVFQDYALFPHMTVEQNAAYGMKGDGDAGLKLQEVLEMLQIAHLARRYPGQISGGERQRTALARALLAGPELLLLDEPLSALDYETRRKVRGELQSLQRRWGIPFILVTHDLEEAAFLGDRVVRLERGRVAGWGVPAKNNFLPDS